MAGVTLLKPTLYQVEGTAAAPDHPALLGSVCNCGYVFFPSQPYGCERCGSLGLSPRLLSGVGHVLASARVHLHHGKGREAPFTIAAIALDDGPIVRTLMTEDDAAISAGDRVVAVLAPVTDPEGAPRLDLRFTVER